MSRKSIWESPGNKKNSHSIYQTLFQSSPSLPLLTWLVSASNQCSFKSKRLRWTHLMPKFVEDVCVLTKGVWSSRALRHLLPSMFFSCTPPQHYIYKNLQVCSWTCALTVHCIGKLKILSKLSPSHPTGFFQSTAPQKYMWGIKLLLSFAPSPSPLGLEIVQQTLSVSGAVFISTGWTQKMDTDMPESWGAGFKQVCVLIFVQTS